jgi:vitamin B12 transporter
MRAGRVVLSLVLLLATAFAGEIKIKVVDPQAAAVSGAELIVLHDGNSSPLAIQSTSADGTALLNIPAKSEYQLKVLAPGFAAQQIPFSGSESPIIIKLQLAGASETVVVTATRTPVPEQEAGASVAAVDYDQLVLMQPFAVSDVLRFLPGAIVATAGQRGGIASLFVRGGDSTYNKMMVDGVPIDEPGGTLNPGVISLQEADRVEFLRGTQSTLYGSDAMTSVAQFWTRTGRTSRPQLQIGADGGNFSTAHGYGSLSGARGRFDYNLFGDQFNSNGEGVNNYYSNTLAGANVGAVIADGVSLRVRARHFDSSSGVSGEWNFNGVPLLAPDSDAHAHQNTLLSSAELLISRQAHWQHRLTGYEFHQTRLNTDRVADRGCDPNNGEFDCYFNDTANVNRAGFNYQGDYTPVAWAQTTVGYEFEDENGIFNSAFFLMLDANGNPVITALLTHGLRLNHAVYAQQRVTRGRFSLVGGARFAHNESFGNRVVPRVAGSFDLLRGGEWFSGTRLRGSFATGIKEPKFEESFGITGIFPDNPNPNLKAEENRALEAGIEQSFFGKRYSLSAVYFHNSFRNQIELSTDPATFVGTFININRSLAHGAEVEFDGNISNRLRTTTSYFYTSTQVSEAPLCTPGGFCDLAGQALLRRPKHAGNFVVSYVGRRWGADLAATFVGRRRDSDFLGLGVDHAAGYGRMDVGGWYAVTGHITAYADVVNALNNHYEEVVGYPALGANFRAGLRFRVGGE